MKRAVFLSFLALALWAAASSPVHAAQTPVTIEEGSPLPLRVLSRPHAVLYADASEATPVDSNLPTFKPFYVYTRPGGEAREGGNGWYQVGSDDKGQILGWIKASDVFEWKQTMCLAYSHPERRHPVLMFEEREALDGLLRKNADQRQQATKDIYSAIDKAGTTPLAADFPVISVEPKMAVDMIKNFYLLPILEHGEVTLENYEGRILRLAAVSGKADQPKSKDSASDIRRNKDFVAAATADSSTATAEAQKILYDVVWVMDTTRSMQPYIEDMRKTMHTVSQSLAQDADLGPSMRFGLWGYRDSEEIKGIEYNTRNFTPELLPAEAFIAATADVKETAVDSVDVAEDLFAGVHDALVNTKWRAGAIRIVIVVGDAPAHETGHKWNSTKLDEKTLRLLATESKVTLFSLHVRPNINKKYNSLAEKQFKALAANPGTDPKDGLVYRSINANNRQEFATEAQKIAEGLQAGLKKTRAGILPGTGETAAPSSAESPAATASPATAASPVADKAAVPAAAKDDVQQALRAATVTWLGSAAKVEPPRDIEAWVTDKDLLNPATQALEVRLLISKRQLDSMAVILSDIIAAGRQNQSSSEDFFSSLQSVSATASRNADQLSKAKTLQESGMIPAFLHGLPYKSQIMGMSAEVWASFGPDEQDQFIEALVTKVEAYKSLHNTPDQWVALHATDSADDHVTPIPLELLP